MLSFPSPFTIPAPWQQRYQMLRVILYIVICTVILTFILSILFPVLEQRFDFRNPGSSQNTILSPRSPDNVSRENGKIETGGIMRADTAVIGNFSQVRATAELAKDSALPENLSVTLRRSYQSFFYPTGEALTALPTEGAIFLVNGTYYALRNEILFPFVSEQALLSRAPKESLNIENAPATLLERYPVSEEWLGFRVGSLLGNATGVFVVVSETEVRPVGSAEIFLALGYNFDDVMTVNEEELGMYRRGRILLLGAAHPDGTLLYDQDTAMYFLILQGTKRPLPVASEALRFLTEDQGLHPIVVSSIGSAQAVSCPLAPNLFGTSVSCTVDTTALPAGFGNDFQMELGGNTTDIEIDTLSTAFETAKNKQNLLTLLSKIKQRFLARVGGA